MERGGEIIERLRPLVVKHLECDTDKVVEGAFLVDDLGANSLDAVEIVMLAEEEFDCEIPDDKIWDDRLTFGGLADIVIEAIAKRPPAGV